MAGSGLLLLAGASARVSAPELRRESRMLPVVTVDEAPAPMQPLRHTALTGEAAR